jgi:MFS family permease
VADPVPKSRLGPFRTFRHRNFALFAAGQVLTQTGTRIHEVAAGWLMWQMTGSAAWLGALALAEIVPRVLFWPLSGLLADSMDRRRLAQVFQVLSSVQAGILAVLAALGLVTPWILLVAAGLLGFNHSIWQPVRMTLISRLVPPPEMPSAVAITSVLANVARVVGPALAGPAIIWGSVAFAFGLNAISFLAVVIALQAMRLSPDETRPPPWTKANAGVWHGFKVVAAHPGMRPLFIVIAIFAVTVRPVADLLPAFAETVFDRGPEGFAALISAMGAGAVLAGVILSWRNETKGFAMMMGLFGMLGAMATVFFAVTPHFWVALVCMALVGVGVTGKNIAAQTLLQLSLDDAVRGRVFSLYVVLFSAAPALGAVVIGIIADKIGLAIPVISSALIGFGASLLVFKRRQFLARHLEIMENGAGRSTD